MTAPDLETLVSLCKRRGFIFPSSEIYGGFGKHWAYRPPSPRPPCGGRPGAHPSHFPDALVECKSCHTRFRVDEMEALTCSKCGGELTEARQFNTMFKTFVGPVEDEASVTWLP